MDITVAALGTRGDVQPMIALGKGLQSAGYHVTMIAGSNFTGWIEEHGLQAIPSVDMEALMNSEQGVAWSESSANPLRQVRMMRSLFDRHGAAMFEPIQAQARSTDLLISSFVSEALVQSVSEATGTPYLHTLLQPQRPTRSGAASLNAIVPRRSSILNRWSGMLGDRLIWSINARTVNRLRETVLGLRAHSPGSYLRARQHAPVIFGFSPQVVPPANDWPQHALATGYWFLDETAHWVPEPGLLAFLTYGSAPVYIGFGSMSSRDPQASLSLILDAVRQSGCRAVIASGWSGLDSASLPDSVYLIHHAPHSWLFDRVAAVIHHGGAGTTAAGLRAGRPTMIIPHMSDQPYWGRRVYELDVGVRPVPRHRLTSATLAQGILHLTGDAQIRRSAGTLGKAIRAETGVETAVQYIMQLAATLADHRS